MEKLASLKIKKIYVVKSFFNSILAHPCPKRMKAIGPEERHTRVGVAVCSVPETTGYISPSIVGRA